jgi:hypothetical protein
MVSAIDFGTKNVSIRSLVEQVLSVLEPIIESNFNESIKEAACKKSTIWLPSWFVENYI